MNFKLFIYSLATDQRNTFLANVLKFFLWILSNLYFCVIQTILFLYARGIFKQHHLPKPVISIGNITLGGVGKTPLVIFIAKLLKNKGLKPAILLRGYMPQKQGSDEAQLLRQTLKDVPVLVGSNRIDSAKSFLKKNNADVFLMDDGFQHWRLFRNLDIVTIDAINPFGNTHLIPRGILREPLSSLRRADMVVLTKTNLPEAKTMSFKNIPTQPFIETIHKPVELINLKTNRVHSISLIDKKTICSLSSIGTPVSFEETLKNLGAQIEKNFTFIDHHVYGEKDIQGIESYCQTHNLNLVITTQKDAVKLINFQNAFKEILVFYLRIEVVITKGHNEFLERIYSVSQR